MSRHRMIANLIGSAAVLFLLSVSCGGGGGEEEGGVALFITDNISFYKQVVMTVNTVQLGNSDTQDACSVTSTPVSLDISNLALDTQLVDVGACPAGDYNRIDVVFKKNVLLMDNKGDTSQCSFVSYLDENNQTKTLQCDPATEICTLSMGSAVRKGRTVVKVLTDQQTNLALDFDLQQFTVTDFGGPACAVTMKVVPLDAWAMNKSDRAQSATGKITLLDTTAQTFTLTRGELYTTVDYSGVIPSLQPNLDVLLQMAQNEGHPVKVLSAIVDTSTNVISATHVYPILEGLMLNLKKAPDRTFTLIYQSSNVITVDYQQTSVDGTLANGAWVSLKLDGYDGTTYLASDAEVLPFGTAIEN